SSSSAASSSSPGNALLASASGSGIGLCRASSRVDISSSLAQMSLEDARAHLGRSTGAARRLQARNRPPGLLHSVVGSPEYMAVEILCGDGYDYRVDFWSLGVIAYELLAGFTPFIDDTPEQVFIRISTFEECYEPPESAD